MHHKVWVPTEFCERHLVKLRMLVGQLLTEITLSSPELCAGEKYDGRLSDVWSLGGTMFMLRFGRWVSGVHTDPSIQKCTI